MAQQGRTSSNPSRRTVKRLDFGVVRTKTHQSKTATSEHSTTSDRSTVLDRSTASPRSTVPRPNSAAPKRPVSPRGRFIDFAPPRPRVAKIETKLPVFDDDSINVDDDFNEDINSYEDEEDLSVSVKTNVSHETVEISAAPASRPRVAPRGLRMDFIRRPKRKTTSDDTDIEKNENDTFDSNLDSNLDSNFDSNLDSNLDSELDSDLDSELASLDELSSDDFAGDDIDAIEAEIAAAAEETNDFVKEPKPLFEDPLVRLSKARENEDCAKTKKSPYASLYSSDKSPFLTSVNVEKRPLSTTAEVHAQVAAAQATEASGRAAQAFTQAATAQAAAKTATQTKAASPKKFFKSSRFIKPSDNPRPIQPVGSALRSSAMKRQLDADAKEIHRQTMMMSTPEDAKSHKTALIIAIILTVILGAAVGAVIYLAFFQNN